MICRFTRIANPLIKLYILYRYFGRKWYGNPNPETSKNAPLLAAEGFQIQEIQIQGEIK